MGANAQTSVPTFTAGDVLTAANMNISARTGVPVFASTVTRDAAFGGTGEKTLAEGQMCYVEGTGFQTYNGTSWVTWGTAPSTGALTLISSTTIGTGVSSVAVSSVFSSTYDNYKIIISGGTASALANMTLQLGSTTTGYYGNRNYVSWAGVNSVNGSANAANFFIVGGVNTDLLSASIDLLGPNLAKKTVFTGSHWDATTTGGGGSVVGYLNDSTHYTGFTIAASGTTFTGGTIRVYGYANS